MEPLTKHALWRRIRGYILQKRESAKVDFKTTIDLSSGKGKSELAKDVCAIANTPGEQGFLIFGIQEHRNDIQIVGFQPSMTEDEFERQIIQVLENFIEPSPPEVQYYQICPQDADIEKPIGVLRIISIHRPYVIKRDGAVVRQGDIFIRHGTKTARASRQEIEQMRHGSMREIVVINFSGHPLTPDQKHQIEEMENGFIGEVIEIPLHFDPTQSMKFQIERAIESINLTKDEWSSQNLYLVLPGLAPGGAAVLAYIHGLRGSFPKVIWIYQNPEDRTRFDVAQILNLQDLRDTAREKRTLHE